MNVTAADYGRTFGAGLAAEAGSERTRVWIVRLVLFVILLLIFEGAIRKWGLPTQGRLLFFIRDPFVLLVYLLALFGGWWPRNRVLLNFGLVLGACGLMLVGMQLMGGATDPGLQTVLAVYGWRNYFFYIPMLFVIGATFRRPDIALVVKLMLLLVIPSAALAVMQFFSPMGAKINIGISDNIAFQFRGLGINATRTRPMGTFTSEVGQRMFVVCVLAIAMANWLAPPRQRLAPMWLLLAASGAILVCLAVSGSRGAVLHSAIVLTVAVGCALVLKPSAATVRALVVPPVIVVVGMFLWPRVLPEGHTAFVDRWNAAAYAEAKSFEWGIIGRALYNFVDFANIVGSTPVLGYGLGLAGNAGIILGVEIEGFSGWTETDWARHVVDLGPLFGFLYVVLRISMTVWLGWLALRALRARADALPMLLIGFAGLEMLQGQMTGHGTVNGFAWIFGGVALAAATAPPDDGRQEAPRGPPAVRYPNLLR